MKTCDCCGKNCDDLIKLGFNFQNLNICEKCNASFINYEKGELTYENLVTDKTTPELKEYFLNISSVTKKENKKISDTALQEDIEKISSDIKFIKNFVIILIIIFIINLLITLFF